MEKPTIKQKVDSFLTFLWDSENGKILGRGGRSWAEITIFYLIYYACLASFFAATMAVFYETIDTDEPRLLGDSSLLKDNPGMGFRPKPNIKEASIVATQTVGENEDYVEDLNAFLEKYNGSMKIPSECSPSTDYGMAEGKPCVVVKVNRVYGWKPDLWDDFSSSGLPMEFNSTYSPNVLPVRCFSREKENRDALGPIDYYPKQGFPVDKFPYIKSEDYLSPLVFAKFSNVTMDKSFQVICRLYAKNIKYDKTELQGSTQFKLRVTSKK